MRREAIDASAAKCGEWMRKASKATGGIADLQVEAVNAMREAGICANVASGREQLVFNAAGMIFARKNILEHLPDGCTMEHLRFAVHLANTIPAPIKKIEDLRPYKREIQLFLGLFGVSEKPQVKEPQQARPKTHFANVIYRVRMLERDVEGLKEEQPIEKWNDEKLAEFLKDTRPARELLGKIEAVAQERGIDG